MINAAHSKTFNTQKNRLLSAVTNETLSFIYDDEGQTETITGATTNTVYGFDAAHRLVSYNTASQAASYQYDGAGNRILATRQGITTQYIHDAGGNLIAEANSSGTITRYYIHGLGLMAMVDAQSGELYVYHFDGTGHIVAMTNSSQQITHRYAYAAFGKIQAKEETVSQPFTYAGQVGIYTEADNVYYMRARYYDAKVGRFISEDPAGFSGGINLYAYTGGNPVNYVDPNGENPVLFGLIIGGISGGVSACLDGCNLKDFAIGAGTGALAGAISPLSTVRTVGGALLKGAALSGGANLAGQTIDISTNASKSFAQDFNVGSFVGSTLGGAVGGKLTQFHPNSLSGQIGSGLVNFGQANMGSLIGGSLGGRPTGALGGTGK